MLSRHTLLASCGSYSTHRQWRLKVWSLIAASLLSTAGRAGPPTRRGNDAGEVAAPQVATPVLTPTPALNGAVLVTITEATSGAKVLYTTDGTPPTSASQVYLGPFLVTSKNSVQALAVLAGQTDSAIARQTFSPNLASGTLVWSDEFNNTTSTNAAPNSAIWTYDTGNSGFGNGELEHYCAYGSNAAPCTAGSPNSFVGTDGYLHIVAQRTSPGVYTSARLKTQGLFSFQYGRIEFRAQVPEAQGLWPAAWLLGNTLATINWPGCGEQDVLERVDGATRPDYNQGSVHGPGFTGVPLGTRYNFPAGVTAATWHTYGMIWKPGSIAYYIDSPNNIYATFTPASLVGLPGASWPFDAGQADFIILNLAVGGGWPGPPNATTPFPAQMLVDYVRIYTY